MDRGVVNGDEYFMKIAFDEAVRAAATNEVPVGAVVVRNGEILGHGRNERELRQRPTAHAEIAAVEAAAARTGSWRLDQCSLYVTLEPCIMCVGVILQARIGRLVFGCSDPKAGAVVSLYRLCEDPRLNHQVAVSHGVLEEQCAKILHGFFNSLRETQRAVKGTERWPSPVEGA